MAKQTITDKIFADEYAKFQKIFKNMGTDAEFAAYLNKNYVTKTGKSFNTDLIFYKRSALGVDTPVGTVLPSKLKRFNEVNNFTTKEVAKANLGNKFVRIEDIKNKVLKKFNLKSFPNFKSEGYPVLNNLEKIPDKIDKVLRGLLISNQPLKQGFMNEIAKLTGISIDSINDNISKSQTYNTIKDQGADLIKKSKGFPKDFYELPFSKQLPYAIEVSSGRPRYTGMGGITRYSAKPQNRIMEFAIRSWDNTKGKGPVKFYDKNGKLITWGYGKKLPYTEVEFSYNGKRHNFDRLKSVNYLEKYFPEAYRKLKAVNNLNVRPVDNPFKKGTKIPLRDLIKQIQVDGYGWKPAKGALDILHGKKGVALEPFTNLTYASRDINQLESGIAQSLRANKITKTQANEAIKTIRQDIKGLTGSELDTAIIDRQSRLAKRVKAGTIGGYRDLSDAVRTLFNTEASPQTQNRVAVILGCVGEAEGGRIGFALGTGAIRCVNTKLTEQPLESSNKIVAGIEEGAKGSLGKIKNAATGFLGFAKKGGKFGAIAAGGAAAAGLVKTFMNDDPTTYLSNEDQQKNMLIDMITGPMVDKPEDRPEILDWQLPVLGAETLAGAAIGAKPTLAAAKGALGAKPVGAVRTAGRILGKGLMATGTPLGLAALEPLHIAGQVQQGDSLGEMATNPWNYAGLAFADQMSKAATRGVGANAAKIMRLGISPAALRLGSRFLGVPGLALSLGISGYETYDDWKNKRGWFSEE